MSKELTGRELELEVAKRVFGFRWFHCESEHGPERNQILSEDQVETWRSLDWQCVEIEGPKEDQFNDDTAAPKFIRSIEAAMRVQDRIAELGLQTRYVLELGKIVDPRESRDEKVALLWWALVHASAEQRCRAALAAIETK